MNIDGLSLAPLVNELNGVLAGGRIDKVFQPDPYSLLLWIRQPGENLRLYVSANPERPKLLITAASPENPAVAPNFCMLLRKHLEDGRIAGIEQHSLDRIVNINIDVRGERGMIYTKRLVIEIMGKHSNIILTQDNLIIDAIKRVGAGLSRFRQVLPGKEYVYPPGQDRLNILAVEPELFVEKALTLNELSLNKAIIAAGFGLGPVTAREIAWRGGFSPELRIENLDEADQGALVDAVASLAEPLKSRQIAPTVVTDGKGQPLALTAFFPEHLKQHTIHSFVTMSQAVEFFDSFKGRPTLPEKEVLTKLVTVELTKLTRKEAMLTEELTQAENAESLRRLGDILMANLYNIPAGSANQELTDIYSEQSEKIVISLDPLLSPLENVQRYYAKYNKAKRSIEHLASQLTECLQTIDYLESIMVALYHAESNVETGEIKQELISSGYIKPMGKRRVPPSTHSLPLTLKTSEGFSVVIGKNNRQNDYVTFKQARPDDIWLHTKDIPGSHVIIRAENKEVTLQAITAAAQLAAYFSKSRQSANVPVDYTKRRYVRKPSGAKPGFVIYDHQSTLYVTPDESIVRKLLTLP